MTETTEHRFSGETLTPESAGYDAARSVFNGLVDRRPQRIMRCSSAEQVAAAIASARADGLPLSVYGGGHGVTGSAVVDGGVCVDLRGIDHVVVDADARTARVGGGATWGAFDAATQEHGLAVTGGRVSTTGVGGLTLGSGSGWLERAFGFVCDNLVSARVVTTDSRIVTASESENPDLFWALRGGGGNFGVVTEFTLRLHPLGPIVFGGMLLYPGFMAVDVLRNWRDYMLTAPDAVGSGVALITAPPAEFVPEPARGQPCVGVVIAYAGDPDEAPAVLAPLLEFGPPAANLCQPMPYVAVQQLLDPPNPKGMHNYWTGDFLTEFPDEAVEAWVEHGFPPVSPLTQLIVVAGGGAIARVDDDATAFGNRQSPFNLHMLGMWPPDPAQDEQNISHIRALSAAMKPWSTGSVYLNFIGDEGLTRVESAYGPEKYARLRGIKRTWDPDNVFRHNQNIPPA
ncbi:FAD-binding oxidoreductase [Nocardioides jiangxiensis]|uniref:FAD-binding oxidoreductase n=1 Tax=Nocardioides jiangxiensis TaxID=3064524 RepID=A0ABT9AYC5_9ACTN|nr:FAD-binding oxidoreductase [Nocardioides sp. WY-20]MDO7866969.1 FAD-binding oxidoreductase [Nocardioides sp. WY-20]